MDAYAVSALLEDLFRHSRLTYYHCLHVAVTARQVAMELGLEYQEVEKIFLGALFHDIGKLKIPRAILHKKGQLTPAEWEKMYKHPEEGCHLLPDTFPWQPIKEIILYHHERWDGRGYYGLSRTKIPLGARIIALADAFDAMTSRRPYQEARGLSAALRELEECSGSQFDPQVVEAFFSLTAGFLKGRQVLRPEKINLILNVTTRKLNSNEL
ncbi:HDIG domain-containing protein [Thermanaeromonas toyohensis ToBE]|uniref:HDIG domain-containing protein n=1 Tax=Thermanaeromonas toyohensis ToBE TaxID=698762 RepID=A0A1W1V5F1_9FIRM|nr:HD-GYP domain-containing protein [Thermanaeromonas toyohensis]SMB88515.1 HDIG domain-containing protein [Thermanaeromonas toyohensis ToBE]